MARVTYRQLDGSTQEVEVAPGVPLMRGAFDNNMAGVVAECGGNCSCATCHVFLPPESAGLFSPASEEEEELLEYLEDSTEQSRLSCQLIVREDHDAIVVQIADSRR